MSESPAPSWNWTSFRDHEPAAPAVAETNVVSQRLAVLGKELEETLAILHEIVGPSVATQDGSPSKAPPACKLDTLNAQLDHLEAQARLVGELALRIAHAL